MHKKHLYFRNGLILLHIIFAIFGFYTYFFNYRLSENLLIQKTLSKQLIIANSGSSSVENLLKSIQNELSSFVFSFAKISESSAIDLKSTREEFIAYMQRSQLPVNGIALYDANGALVIIENRIHIRTGEGQDFSKAEFIKYSQNPLNKGRVFISTPNIGTAGASTGKIIIIVAKPIYFGNSYKGTIAIRVLVDDFKNAFIAPLVSGTDEATFIVDSNAVLIAGNNKLLNKNLLIYAREKKWPHYKEFINKFSRAIKTNKTQDTWAFQNPDEKPQMQLVGISKIDIPGTDKDLYVVVATSKEGIISSLNALKTYGIAWLGFGVFTTILGGLIVMLLRTSE